MNYDKLAEFLTNYGGIDHDQAHEMTTVLPYSSFLLAEKIKNTLLFDTKNNNKYKEKLQNFWQEILDDKLK